MQLCVIQATGNVTIWLPMTGLTQAVTQKMF